MGSGNKSACLLMAKHSTLQSNYAANATGLIREYVLLKTNDPQRSNLSIYLSGYILTKDQLQDLYDKYQDIIRK